MDFFQEEEGLYHSRSRSGECLSSHMLIAYMASPARYRERLSRPPAADSQALRFGRAAHKLILEGDAAFASAYVVADGPVNPSTGVPYGRGTKKYQEWLAGQSGEVLSCAEYAEMAEMRDSVAAHSWAAGLMKARGTGMPEAVLRGEVHGMQCQIRVDLLLDGINDLKTCRDIDVFERDVEDYRYDVQMAFYRMVARELTGQELPVHVVAVDKTPCHVAGVWEMPVEVLDGCEREIVGAMDRLAESRRLDSWPTGYEEMRYYTRRRR